MRSPGLNRSAADVAPRPGEAVAAQIRVVAADAHARAVPVFGAVTTTAGTMSPAAIGRFQRSSLKPSIVLPLGEHVARRLPPAVALVVAPQSVLDRPVGASCSFDVERRRHREAVLVQHLRAVLLLEVLADLLDEERRDARRLVGLAARDDRLLLGRVGLRLRDVALVGHPLQHEVAARRGALHVDERALPLGRLEDAGDERRLLERQLLVRLVEIQPRRRLDAVRAVAEVHLVAVDREDLALGVALLDLDGEDRSRGSSARSELLAWSGRTAP